MGLVLVLVLYGKISGVPGFFDFGFGPLQPGYLRILGLVRMYLPWDRTRLGAEDPWYW